MPSQFETCLAITLHFEGGWSDDPADFGGATRSGITQATYDHFRRSRELPVQSVRAMSCSECRAIYQTFYYQPARCNQMPLPWAALIFDSAVLCGIKRAAEWAQKAVGVPVDGDTGPATLAALRTAGPAVQAAFLDYREAFHRAEVAEFPSQARFLQGWLNRCEALRIMITSGQWRVG